MSEQNRPSRLAVLCRVATQFCAFPVEHVAETMRPLPVEPLAGMPPFMLGIAVIRGAPTPVVHTGRLLGTGSTSTPTRFLTLKVDQRSVALAVDAVLDVVDLAGLAMGELPPLLQAAAAEMVAAVATLDSRLLMLLHGARIVPESLWPMLEPEARR